MEQAYAFMIRVRVPGGVCTPAQWLAMDKIASDYGQRHAAAHDAPSVPVPRRDQEQPEAQHAGNQHSAPGHGGGVRRRQSQRHVQPEPVPVAGGRGGARARARDQRPSEPAHRGLSRDLAGRREGGRYTSGTRSRSTVATTCRASSRPWSRCRRPTTSTCSRRTSASSRSSARTTRGRRRRRRRPRRRSR